MTALALIRAIAARRAGGRGQSAPALPTTVRQANYRRQTGRSEPTGNLALPYLRCAPIWAKTA